LSTNGKHQEATGVWKSNSLKTTDFELEVDAEVDDEDIRSSRYGKGGQKTREEHFAFVSDEENEKANPGYK